MPKPAYKRLTERFWGAKSQAVRYDASYETEIRKLRVDIKRDSSNPGHIHGLVLDPINLKWNLLVERPISISSLKDVNPYGDPNIEQFRGEAESVIKELLALV